MNQSEFQELSESPREIDATRGGGRLGLVLNIACILLILWLARDWLLRAKHWFDGPLQKEIARKLGISSGTIGFLYFMIHMAWPIFHSKEKKKRAEEEQKQFSPFHNPIEEQNSESWSHEGYDD